METAGRVVGAWGAKRAVRPRDTGGMLGALCRREAAAPDAAGALVVLDDVGVCCVVAALLAVAGVPCKAAPAIPLLLPVAFLPGAGCLPS